MISSLIDRFMNFAFTRPWAWLVVRYLLVPALAVYEIAAKHLPEIVAEMRSDWARAEAARAAALSSRPKS
ncbi:hypothetical protein [Luteibacter sp. ME-Dv--P-043b]|uniref:hypothetical protein n=1 Tax=Luteibacter sp. ME-Dv--P-043b TaxID=3040291 RepID=UPI002553B18A|nr:hypothetical protein [Luteibacter sp. ME-Dv--P-043b]